ncbi:hypothetical protein [Microbispora catharanthi]|uniref:hypothetical protein n=1 Tax=Microbispora catharanthi TaxID=1712871 RepID=UPI001F101594|nr:hypothetical protein [Microbispora catharanthi]
MRPAMRGRLPLRGVFRIGGLGDVWHKHALSAVIALAVPDTVLLLLDRLDLAVYTSAGAIAPSTRTACRTGPGPWRSAGW